MARRNRFSLLVRGGLARRENAPTLFEFTRQHWDDAMANHVWNGRNPSGETILLALRSFAVSMDEGAETSLAVSSVDDLFAISYQFATYVCEGRRQTGGYGLRDDLLAERWKRIAAKGFRFTNGKNADNYLRWGLRTVEQNLPELVGVDPGTPPEIVVQYLHDTQGPKLLPVLLAAIDRRTEQAVRDLMGVIGKAAGVPAREVTAEQMDRVCSTCNGSGMPQGVSGYSCPECGPDSGDCDA
jgi:hypothetical protein